MKTRAAVPVLLVLALVLSGCSGGGGPDGGPVATNGDPTDDPFTTDGSGITSGPGGSAAPNQPTSKIKVDPNANFSGGAHKHDWWGDETQVVIMDKTLKTGPGSLCAGASTVTSAGNVCEILIRFDPPTDNNRPNNVYPGTGRMEIKIQVAQLFHPFDLGVATPLKQNPVNLKFKVDTVTKTFAIENINETLTDPPHFHSSSWFLQFYTTTGSAGQPLLAYQGPVKMTVTIFRDAGRELPVDPPHPDLWGPDTAKTLVDQRVTFQKVYASGASTSSGTSTPSLPENNTVLSGTGKMRVTIQWTNELADISKLALQFCPANGNCASTNDLVVRPPMTSDAATKRVYVFEVRPEWWDSPYSTRSRWSFSLYFDDAAGQGWGAFKGTVQYLIEMEKIV